MPRYGNVTKKEIAPDPVYNSVLVQKFINKLMVKGKKTKAEIIVYSAFAKAKAQLKKEPMEIFEKVLENITPLLQIKARRVGGATYQVPIEISKARGQAQAMQWLRDVCRERKGKPMTEILATELVEAYNGQGGAMRKKEDLHKTAEANKAFAHFRW